jgi:hypothetical protein
MLGVVGWFFVIVEEEVQERERERKRRVFRFEGVKSQKSLAVRRKSLSP